MPQNTPFSFVNILVRQLYGVFWGHFWPIFTKILPNYEKRVLMATDNVGLIFFADVLYTKITKNILLIFFMSLV